MKSDVKKLLIIAIPLVLLIKFVFFCADPLPKFYFGDSSAYITTAIYGYIPPDRSFTYGFVIRFVALKARSLTSLIAVQVIASAASAIMLAYALVSFFGSTWLTGLIFGLLCSLDPLQIYYERAVMTETLSLCNFAVYVVLVLRYINAPSIISIVLISCAGLSLISLRLSFLNLVLANSIVVPMLGHSVLVRKRRLARIRAGTSSSGLMASSSNLVLKTLVHLLVAVGLTLFLHGLYKEYLGKQHNLPGAYSYFHGHLLAACMGPIIEPADFPVAELREKVFGSLLYDLKNSDNSRANLFSKGGLRGQIDAVMPNPHASDEIARQTAINAIKRNPIAAFRLAFANLTGYFDREAVRIMIKSELGEDRPMESLNDLAKYFFLAGEHLPHLPTFSKEYHRRSLVWYWLVLCTPVVSWLVFFMIDLPRKETALSIAVASTILYVNLVMVTGGRMIRHMHAESWLMIFSLGVLATIWALPIGHILQEKYCALKQKWAENK